MVRVAVLALAWIVVHCPLPVFAQQIPSSDDDGIALLQQCQLALEAADPKRPDTLEETLRTTPALMCLGFIDGIMAMNVVYQGLVVDPEHRNSVHERGLFCLPRSGIPVIEAARIVVEHLNGRTARDLRSSPKRAFVIIALGAAFPCKAGTGPK